MPQLDFGTYYTILWPLAYAFISVYVYLLATFLVDLGFALKFRAKLLRQTHYDFAATRVFTYHLHTVLALSLLHRVRRSISSLRRISHRTSFSAPGSMRSHVILRSRVFATPVAYDKHYYRRFLTIGKSSQFQHVRMPLYRTAAFRHTIYQAKLLVAGIASVWTAPFIVLVSTRWWYANGFAAYIAVEGFAFAPLLEQVKWRKLRSKAGVYSGLQTGSIFTKSVAPSSTDSVDDLATFERSL